MRKNRNLYWPVVVCGLLFVAAFAAYLPVIHLGFLNYDDDLYVTANPFVQKGLTAGGVHWAFTHFHAANWHPLTWLSHMTDVSLYQMRPAGHHVTNVVFHAINSVVLFLWLRSLTGATGRCAFVAALFALHPLHVESVAWIAERKDVLSAFFGLASLWVYTRYAKERKLPLYLASLFLFALGLLSKPMLVTWPFVMLLLDYWPLQRAKPPSGTLSKSWTSLAAEKIPFLVLSAASCVLTFLAQRAGAAVTSLQALPLGTRLTNVLVGYVGYLGKIFWPTDLAVIYPASSQPQWGLAAGAAVLLIGLTFFAFRQKSRRPYLLVGWLWFLGMLVPVIGLVQVGNQGIADRYTYLPAIGVFLIVAWAGAEIAATSPPLRWLMAGTGVAAVGACVVLTEQQLPYWENSEKLFRHALQVTRDNFVAWNNLGFVLAERQEYREAERCYKNAVEINPSFVDAWYNLGCTQSALNRRDEAVATFETALRINPNFAKAQNNLATALIASGRLREAETQLRAAAAADPSSAEPHANLGALLAKKGNWDEAVPELKRALELKPDLADARRNLSGALAKQGRYDEAAGQLSELLAVDSTNAALRLQFAGTLALGGRTNEAARAYQEILRGNPKDATAHFRLAALLMRQGNATEAIKQYREALVARHDYAEAENNLAWILATHPDAAIRNGLEAVRLAELACQSTGNQQAYLLGTLAAAYAEAGYFSEAISTAEKAEALAKSSGDAEIAATTAKRLELYRAKQPYHDSPP